MPNNNEVVDKAAMFDGLAIVYPLIEASMKESQRISEQLEASNVKKCFLDGFEAGLIEGSLRASARIRRSLGIRENKTIALEGEFYLAEMTGYPYKRRDHA